MQIEHKLIIHLHFIFTISSLGALSPQVNGCTLNRMPAMAEGSPASLPLATLLNLKSLAMEKTV